MALLFDKTLTGTASEIDSLAELGGNIPGTYVSLKWSFTGRTDTLGAPPEFRVRFNGDTGAHYDMHNLAADAGGVADAGASNNVSALLGHMIDGNEAAGRANAIVAEILNYAGTAFFKQMVYQNASDRGAVRRAYIGMVTWKVTDAIVRIQWAPDGGDFPAGSRLTLWALNAT